METITLITNRIGIISTGISAIILILALRITPDAEIIYLINGYGIYLTITLITSVVSVVLAWIEALD